MSRFILCVILLSSGVLAHAASTVEVHEFNDPVVEARYYGLIDELRCPKCQNTNLAGCGAFTSALTLVSNSVTLR